MRLICDEKYTIQYNEETRLVRITANFLDFKEISTHIHTQTRIHCSIVVLVILVCDAGNASDFNMQC